MNVQSLASRLNPLRSISSCLTFTSSYTRRSFHGSSLSKAQYDITDSFTKTVKLLEKNPLAWVVGKDQGEFIFRLPSNTTTTTENNGNSSRSGLEFISLNIIPQTAGPDKFQLVKNEPKDSDPSTYTQTTLYPEDSNLNTLIKNFTTEFQKANPSSSESNSSHYSQSKYRSILPSKLQFQLSHNLIQKLMAQTETISQNQSEPRQLDFRKYVMFVTHIFTPEPSNQGLFDDLIFSITRCSNEPINQAQILERWCELIGKSEKIMKLKLGEVKGRGIKFDEELQYWGNLVENQEVLGSVFIERE
ncbi:hypothetical protein WICPIJ_009487 [Wickerhamomyces pijperi]|uniref:Uncharacterized protein n=1 Tax=Wickerhamomyces pijperi TaxID=599730 RepID=A0A9P8PNH6_WICPI|nr:hypothetical protein WICPIJ_009487 [Wickerhamomyces pijperi]